MKKHLKIIIPVALVLVLVIAASVVLLPFCIFTVPLEQGLTDGQAAEGSCGTLRYRYNPITGVLLVCGTGECSQEQFASVAYLREIEKYCTQGTYRDNWRQYTLYLWAQERWDTTIVLAKSESYDYVQGCISPTRQRLYFANPVANFGEDVVLQGSLIDTVYFTGDAPAVDHDLFEDVHTDPGTTVICASGASGFEDPVWSLHGSVVQRVLLRPWWSLLLG